MEIISQSSIKSIKEFSDHLQYIIEENESLKISNDLYRDQLAIILVNNKGVIENMPFNELNKINWDMVSIGIGLSSVTFYNKISGMRIYTWEDFPKLT